MFERIRSMLIKEFIQVYRDPKMRIVLFVSPVVQMLLFGYAATTDVKHVALAVHDLDNSVSSRELIARFAESGYFDILARTGDEAETRDLIDRGEVSAVLRLDKGFDEDLRGGRTATAQLILDGTDSNTAGIVLDYAGKIGWQFSRSMMTRRFRRLEGSFREPTLAELESRAWFNANLESHNYYVPGVVAMIVTMATILLTGMAVVREKEIGTMEQIMVSPIRPSEFILGKTIPFGLIGLADMLVASTVAVAWFDVPLRGGLLTLTVATVLYLLTTLGVGLLISTVSQTQQQALMSTMFFYFPTSLLSGFAFPVANMPTAIRWLTLFNPLRHFLVIIRGIFLKGVGVEVLWPQMAALGVMGLLTLWLAATRFRKTLA